MSEIQESIQESFATYALLLLNHQKQTEWQWQQTHSDAAQTLLPSCATVMTLMSQQDTRSIKRRCAGWKVALDDEWKRIIAENNRATPVPPSHVLSQQFEESMQQELEKLVNIVKL